MPTSDRVTEILQDLDPENPRMGDIRKIAARIKTDQQLADELWASGEFSARLVSILVMNVKALTQTRIETLITDMGQHPDKQRDRLSEWFMANQLMKSKQTLEWMTAWQKHKSPTHRRLFWYHQARMRWTGKNPAQNSEHLMASLKQDLESEVPEVQWAMNFAAAQIGIFEPEYRNACIELGKRLALYKDEKVPRNCTPNYLPEFIAIEVAKRETA